ncbi:C40 family peptidase [Sphaerisporangium sp. TRM90804]|uniref:C40 family peptidase n=1 Tax=Sphaerisporangium sp. TRM90804 TaxID=3031113 RepID=UPI00244A328B|nr:C40 family peptidase [Sphaerisporangium sp. TRM90804]MDH2427524.1 NlpC/P60 family protein [Sphaerisporangium sp. TRM90804]
MPVLSVRKKVVPVAAGLAAAVLLTSPGSAIAEPRPTVAQAEAKLAKLEGQAEKMVERYNTVDDRYKKARKGYQKLDDELKAERAKVEDLRESVVTAASGMYQYGQLMSVAGVVSQDDPSGLLAGLAVAGQVSAEQAETLEEFDVATRGLRERRDKAKGAYDDLTELLDEVRGERKEVEKLVGEQERLLRRLNRFNAGNPNSAGVTYKGPASGNARVALQFAYKQVGKPYRFGGTGPDSYDCSGFAQASWAKGGVKLPRTTYQQWAWGAKRRVSVNDLQAGDLVFTNGLGHMGIYAGDGKIVHAPRTGDVVKIVPFDSYWRGRLVGVVRP